MLESYSWLNYVNIWKVLLWAIKTNHALLLRYRAICIPLLHKCGTTCCSLFSTTGIWCNAKLHNNSSIEQISFTRFTILKYKILNYKSCMILWTRCKLTQRPSYVYNSVASGGSRGQIRPWPPIEVGNGVWPTLGGRKSNDSVVNLAKCKGFGPPRIDVGYGFTPPYGESTTLKHGKDRWLKRRSSEILGDRWHFLWKCGNFWRNA